MFNYKDEVLKSSKLRTAIHTYSTVSMKYIQYSVTLNWCFLYLSFVCVSHV
jgi:hypothetical protein